MSYQVMTDTDVSLFRLRGIRAHATLRRLFPRQPRTLTFVSAMVTIALLSATLSPAADAGERRSQAIAQSPKIQAEGFKLQRKDFRFDGFTAWLKRNGDWHIEGQVSHSGLLCGTYEVGMRFGIGKPDCTEVQWVSADRYATSENHCNNAVLDHSGTEIDESLETQFDAITCAERVIRCTGNCK